MLKTSTRLGGLGLATALLVAACGGGSATTAPSAAPATAPASTAPSGEAPSGEAPSTAAVSGSIAVSGSSTVEPISAGVAAAFKALNPDFNAVVEGPGTGDGFARFCAGEIDIADASRAIKAKGEADVCAAAGIEYVELKVAYDGITVMTSPNNSAVTCLSFADLYALIGPESQGFDSWADAATIATELGSNTTFPDAPLVITAPGEESGTFDYFNEAAIQPIAVTRNQVDGDGAGLLQQPDYTSTGNDNVIIQGISDNDSPLGYVGFAFAEENQDKVKELEVAKDVNGTCVAPSAETISDASYPLARPLFIYVNSAKATENPAVGAYVDFYLADGTISKVLETVPYVNLPANELDASRSAWAGR